MQILILVGHFILWKFSLNLDDLYALYIPFWRVVECCRSKHYQVLCSDRWRINHRTHVKIPLTSKIAFWNSNIRKRLKLILFDKRCFFMSILKEKAFLPNFSLPYFTCVKVASESWKKGSTSVDKDSINRILPKETFQTVSTTIQRPFSLVISNIAIMKPSNVRTCHTVRSWCINNFWTSAMETFFHWA